MVAERVSHAVCPVCRAENSQDAAFCFLCGQAIAGSAVVDSKKPDEVVETRASKPAFPWIGMLLGIAAVAILLGLGYESPGLALVVAIPTLMGCMKVIGARLEDQRPRSWLDHVAVFAGTLAAMVVVTAAALATCFFTCVAVLQFSPDRDQLSRLPAAIVIGAVAGLTILICLMRYIRETRRKMHA